MSERVGADCPFAGRKLPCDDCPISEPMMARIEQLDARLDRIDEALFGDGNGRSGIVDHVETLVNITKVSRSTLRVFMWFGAGVVALATAAYQIKVALTGLFR